MIPVPISRNRMRERGFNQVEEILKELDIGYKTIDRIKDTEHMYSILEAVSYTHLEGTAKLKKSFDIFPVSKFKFCFIFPPF